jgi:hypothetical protein
MERCYLRSRDALQMLTDNRCLRLMGLLRSKSRKLSKLIRVTSEHQKYLVITLKKWFLER